MMPIAKLVLNVPWAAMPTLLLAVAVYVVVLVAAVAVLLWRYRWVER